MFVPKYNGERKGFVIFSNYMNFVLCIKHLVYAWPAVSMCTELTGTRRLKWIQDPQIFKLDYPVWASMLWQDKQQYLLLKHA